jgi:glycopeptide antibiotics resistance protein
MNQWLWPAYVSAILAGLLFLAVLIPIVILQYRRYGRFSWARFAGAGALALYLVALVAYTFLPLPSPQSLVCNPALEVWQSRPFASFDDISEAVRELGARAALTSPVVLQVVFNVILFIPWGIFTRRYFGRGLVAATLTGAAVSFLIETTQFTGIWGLYECAYRVADVDDLMTNTAGALIGALIAPIVLGLMPQSRTLAASRMSARPVTVWRRIAGQIIDLFLYTALSSLLSSVYVVAGRMVLGSDFVPRPAMSLAILAFTGAVTVVLPACVGLGASWGQQIVWLGPSAAVSSHGGRASMIVRMSSGLGLYWLLDFAASTRTGLSQGADVLSGMVAIVCLVSVFFTRGHRGITYLLAGSDIADTRSRLASPRATR